MQHIAAALIAAKKAFGPVLKEKDNQHFRSKYADLAACLDAVNDACLANGIMLYQETFEDMTGVTVETVFLHESGETLRCGKLHVPAAKNDPQGFGSALSYARRYSLLAACGIAAEDDDGNAGTAAVNQSRNPKRQRPPTAKEEAANITNGVTRGEAKQAALYLAGLGDKERDEIWQHLTGTTQDELTSNWPD